jgi:diketogulonate reductase-like aldo/keto reductase
MKKKAIMKPTAGTRVKLNNGVQMPVLGFGTWDATGREGRRAVSWALEAGYRLIDTAAAYGNESEVGEAIRASGLPQDEIFVTTKLWPSDLGYESVLRAFEASRRRLGFERLDLYLIHWPGDDRRKRVDAWRALEKIFTDGLCRAIGVSNYSVGELREVLDRGGVSPAVNQVPYSPFEQQRGLHEFCQSRGIQLEGYSPLTRGRRLSDGTLLSLAAAYRRTPAQVMLRWAIQKGVVVIPKSVHRERIVENAGVFDFEIGPEDMAALDGLDAEKGADE